MIQQKIYSLLFLTLFTTCCCPNAYREAVKSNNLTKLLRVIEEQAPGIDEQKSDFFRETALQIAVKQGKEEMARALLKAGANRFTTNNKQQTPLHAAAQRDIATILLTLIIGALPENFDVYKFVNFQDNFGNTALHYAAGSGFEYICSLLLSFGESDPLIKNHVGNTALDLCYQAKQYYLERRAPLQKRLLKTIERLEAATDSAKSVQTNPFYLLSQEGIG